MIANKVKTPFVKFSDIDGNPLEDGYIYIGEKNQNPETHLVNVYWDEALTIPAAQPIRTIGGFPSRSGTAANIFTVGDYSITVKNKNGVLIHSAPVSQGLINSVNVNSIAELTGLESYGTVNVKGYYTANDGGGGIFNYDATQSAVNNGGTIINGWVRQYSDEINVKQFGVIDGQDNTTKIQNALDSLSTGQTLTFKGIETSIINSDGLNLMRNASWKTGYTTTERKNITIDLAGCELVFAVDVPFTGIFPNMPIFYRPAGYELTQTRQPQLFICSLDGLTIKNGIINGNMQNRGAALGLPGLLGGEHCLMLISCKDSIVENIITKDSMGDGMNFGYPYLAGFAGVSQFYGAESLDGLCDGVQVSNTKGYRHSRLAIAVVGAVNCVFNNIYGEDIDNITDYKSLGGPGSVIDIEYDISLSYYDGAGFSLCEKITVDGVHGKNCTYGGAVQVQNGRDIVVKNVILEGPSLYGIGRIEGDYTTNNGAKNVSYSNATWNVNNTASGVIGRFGGDGVSIADINVYGGNNTGCITVLKSRNLNISNLKFNNQTMSDSTGSMFLVESGAIGLKIKNVTANLNSTSAVRQVFLLNSTGIEMDVDGLTITGADTVVLSALSRGVFHFAGATNIVKANRITINAKGYSLWSGTKDNTIEIRNSTVKGLVVFPSTLAVTKAVLERVTIESMYNVGSANDAILYLAVENLSSIKIKDCFVYSLGTYGYNKSISGIRLSTAETAFTLVTTYSCDIDGLTLEGGRQSDGILIAGGYANGVYNDDAWDVAAVRNQFRCNKININNHIGKRITLPSGATQYAIGYTNYGLNLCYLPNQSIDFIPIDTIVGSYFFKQYFNAGATSPNYIQLNFTVALPANQDIIIR